MSVAALVESVRPEGGPATLSGAGSWLQGRTLYGGASALIAYTAAIRAFDDLPPLRGAQIAFIAPLGGELEIRRQMLRRGRNVAVVRSELWSEGNCALTATWLFGAAREANAAHPAAIAPASGAPEDGEDAAHPLAPAFIRGNFDLRRARRPTGADGSGAPTIRQWVRLRESHALDPVSEIVLIGDVLPPGAARAMQRPGPISSVNWSFNLLAPAPTTREGWWLAETASQHADHGYSSERLRLWNASGQQVLEGMQCVAVFG